MKNEKKSGRMTEKLKELFFPDLSAPAQRIIDTDSIRTIYYLSLIILVFELLTLAFFFLTHRPIDREEWISVGSVGFCIVACFIGRLVSGALIKKPELSHTAAVLFRILYLLALSAWAIWASYRQYCRGEQLLTFYALELLTVCFIPLTPWIGALIMLAVHAALYLTLLPAGGAAGLNILNYLVLALVSALGTVLRYHTQVRMAEKTVQLEYANRHDALTGLRNRGALDEDAPKLIGRHVRVYMVDIDYFKKINDVHGHIAGDRILYETAQKIKELFPACWRYRYGGDEFLVLSPEGAPCGEEFYRFRVPDVMEETIVLGIGTAEGTPADQDQLFGLIAQADAALYTVKKKTHTGTGESRP